MDSNEVRDDRSSLLAAFARAPERTENTAVVTMSPSSPIDRVVGAQQVAVHRDEQKILERVKVLAAAAGDNWYYRYPVKSKGGATEFIEGPSIKLANDLARVYGNCEVDSRVTDLGESWLIYARFTDYESGFTMTRPFQQRKSQRGMRADDARALDINLQIGASKAIRNVIVNSLQTFADFAFEEARHALVEKIGKNIEGWRERCIQRIAERKIKPLRVERIIGRNAKDWTAPDIARIVAMMQSIADGMSTADEVFPPIEASPASHEAPVDKAGETGGEQATSPVEPKDASTVAARSASSTAEEKPAAVDNPNDPLELAYRRGQEAKKAGTRRTAYPGEYRTVEGEPLVNAWLNGYDGKANAS